MNLTEEQLQLIRDMGALFLSPKEIACILGLDIDLFQDEISNHRSPAYVAWFKGRTESKYEIRKKVISLAKMGSPQAEMLAEKYIEEQEIDQNV
jgi:hypothetical protein